MIGTIDAGLPAGVTGRFTVRGSASPYDGNLALHVGDDPAQVEARRAALARQLGVAQLCFARQVHGADVHLVEGAADRRSPGLPAASRAGAGPGQPGEPLAATPVVEPAVDALVTSRPGTALAVLVADCLPVLLAAPRSGVVAAVHAGRAGLVAGVLQATLRVMADAGASPTDIVGVIGPAVCGYCYEVPAALRDEVAGRVPGTAASTRRGTPSLDLPAGAAGVLERAGVQVRDLRICTMEDGRLFSHRRAPGAGRAAGVVLLDG